jgi:hypothetical protein
VGVIVIEGRVKDPANGKELSTNKAGKSLVNAEVGSKRAVRAVGIT